MHSHYTYADAARFLGVSYNTIRRWAERGLLVEEIMPNGTIGVTADSVMRRKAEGKLPVGRPRIAVLTAGAFCDAQAEGEVPEDEEAQGRPTLPPRA